MSLSLVALAFASFYFARILWNVQLEIIIYCNLKLYNVHRGTLVGRIGQMEFAKNFEEKKRVKLYNQKGIDAKSKL